MRAKRPRREFEDQKSMILIASSRRGLFRRVSALRCVSSSSCPFQVLGISKTASYDEVRQSFVQLALKHHPDTSPNKSGHTFASIRAAFEAIRNDEGRAALVGEAQWTDDSLSTWFHDETGQRLCFHMNSATRREVSHVANTMSPGGLDRGGMWEMARTVAQAQGNTSEDPLQVTGTFEPNATTQQRRRRRK